MIIWSGWGILVFVIAVIGLIVGFAVVPSESWAFAAGALVAAAGNFGFTQLLDRRKERTLIDPQSNQQVILRHGDSLFFIPVRYWTWIFLGLGAVMAANALFKT